MLKIHIYNIIKAAKKKQLGEVEGNIVPEFPRSFREG